MLTGSLNMTLKDWPDCVLKIILELSELIYILQRLYVLLDQYLEYPTGDLLLILMIGDISVELDGQGKKIQNHLFLIVMPAG
ncbi:MAG TPA: hypothetical protein DEO39_06670 [Clostridiales bacterium]|nr:hypothetical protein [Clostridiales bacterium]